MGRLMTLALVGALLLGAGPALAAEEGRISGQVVEIRPDGRLVIEEQGPWKGPNTGLSKRTVSMGPETAIRVVRAKGTWEADNASPGYAITPGDFRELNRGDFITVITRGSNAVAIEVMRPDGPDTGLASPAADSQRK